MPREKIGPFVSQDRKSRGFYAFNRGESRESERARARARARERESERPSKAFVHTKNARSERGKPRIQYFFEGKTSVRRANEKMSECTIKPSSSQIDETRWKLSFSLKCGDLKYLIVAVSHHGRGRPSTNKLARSLAFTNLFCIAQCRSLSRK